MKTFCRHCICLSVFVHDQESRRPENQLWSSFFTLLSSLTWAFVRGAAAGSVAWLPTGACSGRKVLVSISSSESSSSFSLSISSSACWFSPLGPWALMRKNQKGNMTLHIFRDKQEPPLSECEVAKPQVAWIPAALHNKDIMTTNELKCGLSSLLAAIQ